MTSETHSVFIPTDHVGATLSVVTAESKPSRVAMFGIAAVTTVSLLLPAARPGTLATGQSVTTHIIDESTSVTMAPDAIAQRFDRLVNEWQTATRFSSAHDAVMHLAYQQIIGMGPRALPLILQQLRADSNHWFWALFAITGEDVASEVHDVATATTLWLSWGERAGLI